jgi:alpha-tubulin suppressor-like RCC1 family protein
MDAMAWKGWSASMRRSFSFVLALILAVGLLPVTEMPPAVAASTVWRDVPGIQQVSAGGSHTVAIKTDGTLWAWGQNNFGQLGIGSSGSAFQHEPVQIGTAADWAYVSAGRDHTVAVRANGALWAWGRNAEGQLGDASITQRNAPVQIMPAKTDWRVIPGSVSAGITHTMAIDSAGSLWVWGNRSSISGISMPNSDRPFQQINLGTQWRSVAAGHIYTLAIDTNNRLHIIGPDVAASPGGLIPRYKRTQVNADIDWHRVSMSSTHVTMVKENGRLYSWQYRINVDINDIPGENIEINIPPVRIGTDENWQTAAAGRTVTIATKTDGTLWEAQSIGGVFTRVGADTGWINVSAGESIAPNEGHRMALRANNHLWGWGRNNERQLGDYYFLTHNNTRADPVVIWPPSTTDSDSRYLEQHQLIVVGGTTSGWYTAGASVTVTPHSTTTTGLPLFGYTFMHWEFRRIDSGAVISNAALSAALAAGNSMTFTMPAYGVIAEAVFSPPTKFTVTVVNGGVNGPDERVPGDRIDIFHSGPVPDGFRFTGWTSSVAAVTLPSTQTASFTMPDSNITLTPIYSPIEYQIFMTWPGTVVGSHLRSAGVSVSVEAPAAHPDHGGAFLRWDSSPSVVFSSGNNAAFTMPASHITVWPVYSEIPSLEVLAPGGTGCGFYAPGLTVTISANPTDAEGRQFIRWEFSPSTIAHGAQTPTTTITMPTENAWAWAIYGNDGFADYYTVLLLDVSRSVGLRNIPALREHAIAFSDEFLGKSQSDGLVRAVSVITFSCQKNPIHLNESPFYTHEQINELTAYINGIEAHKGFTEPYAGLERAHSKLKAAAGADGINPYASASVVLISNGTANRGIRRSGQFGFNATSAATNKALEMHREEINIATVQFPGVNRSGKPSNRRGEKVLFAIGNVDINPANERRINCALLTPDNSSHFCEDPTRCRIVTLARSDSLESKAKTPTKSIMLNSALVDVFIEHEGEALSTRRRKGISRNMITSWGSIEYTTEGSKRDYIRITFYNDVSPDIELTGRFGSRRVPHPTGDIIVGKPATGVQYRADSIALIKKSTWLINWDTMELTSGGGFVPLILFNIPSE